MKRTKISDFRSASLDKITIDNDANLFMEHASNFGNSLLLLSDDDISSLRDGKVIVCNVAGYQLFIAMGEV